MPGSSSRKKKKKRRDPFQVRLIEKKGSIVHSKLRTKLIVFILSSSVDFFQSKFANVCKWATEFSFDRLGRKWEVSCIYLKLTRWFRLLSRSSSISLSRCNKRKFPFFLSDRLFVLPSARNRKGVITRQSIQGFYLNSSRSNVFFSREEKDSKTQSAGVERMSIDLIDIYRMNSRSIYNQDRWYSSHC